MTGLVLLFSWDIGDKTFSVRRIDGRLEWRIDYNSVYKTTRPHVVQWFRVLETAMESLEDVTSETNNAKYADALILWREYRKNQKGGAE